MTSKPMEIIHIAGTHRELGRQIGEACRERVKNSIANAKRLLEDAYSELQLNWEGSQIQARKYLPFAEERYPKYIEEMRGIAEGSGVPFSEVAVINALEAVTMDALHLTKCTSLAVNQEHTTNGHVLIAHNEDWIPEDEDDVYLLHAKPDGEPAFLSITYGALLPNIGINSYGIGQCCDSVYPTDSRIGIPRVIASRAVLSSRTPGEAMRHMLAPRRAAGYNHLLAHESGEIYNVEVSAKQFAIIYAQEGYLAHTNHYLDESMKKIENEPDELISSRIRYWRAFRLLKQEEKHNIKSLQSILKDHINQPDSICNHDQEGNPLDREKTIASLVMDLTNRQIHAAWGNPCQAAYHTYQLEE